VSQVRPAAVAGMFYPRDARELQREVAELIDGVENLAPRFGHPKAIVVPHAGYIYSGPVAARAYDELGAARGIVRRVVLRDLLLPGRRCNAHDRGNTGRRSCFACGCQRRRHLGDRSIE
jgi:hypothetical protein